MNTIERFFIFLDNKGLKHTPIEKQLGLSNGYLGKMRDRKASIGSEIIEKIISFFPELNVTWLITGKGEMLLQEEKNENKKEVVAKNNVCSSCIEKERYIAIQAETIATQKKLILQFEHLLEQHDIGVHYVNKETEKLIHPHQKKQAG